MTITNPDHWGTRAQKRMKELRIFQDDLAKALGVTRPHVSHLLTGRRGASLDQLTIVANTLKMDPVELQYGLPESEYHQIKNNLNDRKIPVLEWEQAVSWNKNRETNSENNHKEFIPYFYSDNENKYALRIKNDSMQSSLLSSKNFREGEIIIVDTSLLPKENNFVIAYLPDSDEIHFRQYVKENGAYYLKPTNQQYHMLKIDKNVKILGVVIAHLNILI